MVLLVAGIAAGVQLTRPAVPVAGGVMDDRCWAAIESAGKTAEVPPRAEWTITGSHALGDDVVTSFLAAGKPVFCETTVTVSDPGAKQAYGSGSRTGLLLYTATGLGAGVADPSWPLVELSLPDGLGVTVEPVTPRTGVFTAFTATDPATTTLWAGMSVQASGPVPVPGSSCRQRRRPSPTRRPTRTATNPAGCWSTGPTGSCWAAVPST